MESPDPVCRWRQNQSFHWPDNFCLAPDSARRWVSIIIAMPRCWRRVGFPASCLALATSPRPTRPTNGFRWLHSNAPGHCCCAFCGLFLEPKPPGAVQVRMLAAKAEIPPMTQAAHRATFFRQSGWLMIANIGGGVLMWAVHFLNKFIDTGEYSS